MRGESRAYNIELEFSGDFRDIVGFNEKNVRKNIQDFIRSYGEEKEIFSIDIYLKKFNAASFGRHLIFCNLTANTEFGIVSVTGMDWGIKPSIRQALKSVVVEINKLAESEYYGSYAEAAV